MHINSVKNKKILYAALNWGLGHVTRSIGIIRQLVNQENEIIIICDKHQEEIFKSYFPSVSIIEFPGYPFNFRGKNNWGLDIILSIVKLIKHIKSEKKKVENIVKENSIDLILSDHRYGLFSKEIFSIFITHQLQLPLPWYYKPAQWWHKHSIKKFNFVWVLDDDNSSLAGKLSSTKNWINTYSIGWYSRFEEKALSDEIYYLFVISGPEKYVNDFYSIFRQFNTSSKKTVIISPYKIDTSLFKPDNTKILITSKIVDIDEYFYKSSVIISRYGYSTLMDLKILKKKSILFPSKGQNEQEYLSILHNIPKNNKELNS
ncbi:MAG: hypothetical protein HYU67_11255 [Flavobacteriia bacterium]|nr:hypothetical protein [Flavobacteriia bacterium]